jgi:uncharacterized membrane protein
MRRNMREKVKGYLFILLGLLLLSELVFQLPEIPYRNIVMLGIGIFMMVFGLHSMRPEEQKSP